MSKRMITNCAMIYGVILGLYWIVVFLLRLVSSAVPVISFVYVLMLSGTLYVAHHFGRMFIISINSNGERVSFFKFCIFGILFFFYASLLDGIVQFVYYQFINPTYIHTQFQLTINTLKSISTDPTLIEQFEKIGTPSAIQMVMQFVWNSVMMGGVVFAFFSLFMLRKQDKGLSGDTRA